MFDNGVPALVRHSFGGHVPDLVGPEHAGLLIESKLYRHELVEGISQLLSYMQTLSGTDYTVRAGYLIVFRLDGPLYSFEQDFRVDPAVVHPILIDIGPGGGHARRRVKEITAAEVLRG